jgi:uncharacterized protein (DUF1697 family)
MNDAHIALLRGVNVGGRNRLPMAELAAIVGAAGGREARTYIQSGNVVFRLDPSALDAFRVEVADAIEGRFGFRSPVVVRSLEEWAAMMERNPFVPADENALHVAFLAEVPSPERAARLDPQRSPGDRFALHGRDLYLLLGNGVAGSKLTNDWLDRTLATVSTVRNWRTVRALGALAGG